MNMYFPTFIMTVIVLLSTTDLSKSEDTSSNSPHVPVVLWHGMADSCDFNSSITYIVKEIVQREIPNIYVKCIRFGNTTIEDIQNSIFANINKQISELCEELSSDPKLQNGYNALGFSQAGQFLGVVQRCPNPRVINLISMGGQQQGVLAIPNCAQFFEPICQSIHKLISLSAYTSILQEHSVQASYWHDPMKENEYRKYNTFMADINNENIINKNYIENLQSLKKLVLIKYANDTQVLPPESEWFGYYEPGGTNKVLTLNETDLYKEDRLGLKKMINDKQIVFIEVPGDHLNFTDEWFVNTIVNEYFKSDPTHL